jgi:diketogulonate reductase-like aldo/keto reductase
LTRALEVLGGPTEGGVVSIQNEFSPLYRHDLDVLEVCEEHGVAFLPWSPLGGSRGIRQVESDSGIAEVARNRGLSPAVVALAWVVGTSPAIIAIPGATRAATIRECAQVFECELTESEMESIWAELPPSLERSHELEPTAPFRR